MFQIAYGHGGTGTISCWNNDVYADQQSMSYRTKHQDREIEELKSKKERDLKNIIAYFYSR